MAGPRESDHGPAWMVQAALIARRFYIEDRSKVEIADELGLSRFKVARILEEARSLGLVDVTIRLPAQIDADLSTRVVEALGLRRAVVVASHEHSGDVRTELGRVAADLLNELVTEADVLGLTCSRSVTATTQALQTLARCDVVQLTGTLATPDTGPGSVESVQQVARVNGGTPYPVYAPMLLPDAATARALAAEPGIASALARTTEVTVAAVAVGGWAEEFSTVWVAATEQERRAAEEAGAVGEIGGRLFDARGSAVRTALDERVLGMTLAQLAAIDEVVGLAHQPGRAAAVAAAAAGGLVTSVVCDDSVAVALLDSRARSG